MRASAEIEVIKGIQLDRAPGKVSLKSRGREGGRGESWNKLFIILKFLISAMGHPPATSQDCAQDYWAHGCLIQVTNLGQQRDQVLIECCGAVAARG